MEIFKHRETTKVQINIFECIHKYNSQKLSNI